MNGVRGSIWLIYLMMIAIYLLQQPLSGSLMGNWDNWFYMSMFNYYHDYVQAFLLNEEVYSAFFPDKNPPFLYGEPSFFSAFIYLPLQWLTGNEMYAYYIFTSVILSLNAFSLFLISNQIFKNVIIAFLSGLFLVCSNYQLSSLDQQNVISIYPGLFSIYFILKASHESKPKLLLLTAVFAAIQLYCSGYHFFFLGITWACLALFFSNQVKSWIKEPIVWISVISLIIYVIPFLYIYLFDGIEAHAINTVDDDILIQLSLHWKNLFQTHPYNLIYGLKTDRSLLHYIGSVGIGIMAVVLSISGASILTNHKLKFCLVALVFLGLLFALGPVWSIGSFQIQSPVFLILKLTHLDQYMRTPIRAFIVALVPICMVSAFAVYKIATWNKYAGFMVLALWAIENIPYQLQKYESERFLEVPETLWNAVNKLDGHQAIWIKPSSIHQQVTMPPGLGEINREYIYMFWQTKFKKNMVNGMNGYYPKETMKFRLSQNIGSDNNDQYRVVYLQEMEIEQ